MTCWEQIDGRVLNQGDLLRGIDIPVIRTSFPGGDDGEEVSLDVDTANVIVITQSCDLEQGKTPTVLVAQFYSLSEFETVNSNYKAKGKWNDVARGRVEGLHLLRSPENPDEVAKCLVVDFRALSSLPVEYVSKFAGESGRRWRLQPPYLEHFSQAFGRYFMRVALPRELSGF